MPLKSAITSFFMFCSKCKLKSSCCDKKEVEIEKNNKKLKKSTCFKFSYNEDKVSQISDEIEIK